MRSNSHYAFKTKLLKSQMSKNQVCKKKSFFEGYPLEDAILRLKKLIRIIFKFHTLNKRILFTGVSLHQQQQLNRLIKNTKHVLTLKSLWGNGIITNRLLRLKHTHKNKEVSEVSCQLKKKFDLIVVLNESSNLTVLKEGYTFKIPLSSLHANLNALNAKAVYKVPGNFSFREENCFFCSVLCSVLRVSMKLKSSGKS